MAEGTPDWTKAVKIYGVDEDGNVVGVLLDAAGRMEALMKGWDSEALHTLLTDDEGRLITVLRDPINDRYLAINAAGQLVAIMMGTYGTTPTTIATDEGGRMIAVVSDPENLWGERTVIGNAELAARLGSPNTYQRQGSLLFMDNFDHGLSKCVPNAVGGGAGVELTVEHVLNGGYACKLTSGNDGVDPLAEIEYRIGSGVIDQYIGLEIHWARGDDLAYIQASLGYETSSQVILANLRVDITTGDVWLWEEDIFGATAWVRWAIRPVIATDQSLYHAFKYVVNPLDSKYKNIFIDEVETGPPGGRAENEPHISDPQIILTITAIGTGGNNGIAYIDSVICTTNEPAHVP